MAIELDTDELDLFLWNDSQSYFQGLKMARAELAGKKQRWGWFVNFCIQRYRADIGPARPVKGLKADMTALVQKDFLEHVKECVEVEAKR